MAHAVRLALAAMAAITIVTCTPPAGNSTPPSPPPTATVAPCKASMVSDTYTEEGINTRTGCMLQTLTLGAVSGASDLSFPVAIVRNEGNVPPAGLYESAWFGKGAWLNADEFVTKDGPDLFTLHSPMGDAVYDFKVRVPWYGQLDPADDTQSKLFRAYRTRPFDGTFLWEESNGTFTITVGNPADSRSLAKLYRAPLTAPGANPAARLLSRLEQASIYKGPLNFIDIRRSYVAQGVAVTFASSLYQSVGHTPLEIRAPEARPDALPGYAVKATSTLLHGWQSTVTALVGSAGNLDQLVSSGRNAQEQHTLTLTYYNEQSADRTVLKSSVETEGTAVDARILKSFELTKRADATSTSWPFAVQTWVDNTRPGAAMSHIVSECDTQVFTNSRSEPRYFTFNSADGTSVAYQYADASERHMLVRTKDALGQETELQYNPSRGGGPTNANQPVTAYELKYMIVRSPGGGPMGEVQFMYRFDKFTVDTYGVPVVGKVSFPYSAGDRQVFHRAVYGDFVDTYNGNRRIRSFIVPRGVAGMDARTRWEYRGLDGFTYEIWNEDGVMHSFRHTGADANANGTFNTEHIDTFLMGVAQHRVTRDRFGRVTAQVDYDPVFNPAGVTDSTLMPNLHPTTTYHITPEGSTDRIHDSVTGETTEMLAWNGPRSAVTVGQVTRGGQTVSSFDLPTDDIGNQEGPGSMGVGPFMFFTNTTRATAGLLRTFSITGPDSRTLDSELTYRDGDMEPASESANSQRLWAAAPMPLTATAGCQ